MGFLAAHTPHLGGLAKQETGHPPVISRPNDQALYNYGTNGLYRTQDFGLAYFFAEI